MRIEDIYVTAERVRNTNAAILTERQRSAVIGDGISAEQIRLSPDGTSSDALRRVTGLSIVNNKFVFIRGVTDRYNATTLNGIGVTSTDTDVDKKSFSFDLIPASLISNTIVAKTATPDLPGDFSGGLVQVSTLDFPSGFMASASVETGYDERRARSKDILVGTKRLRRLEGARTTARARARPASRAVAAGERHSTTTGPRPATSTRNNGFVRADPGGQPLESGRRRNRCDRVRARTRTRTRSTSTSRSRWLGQRARVQVRTATVTGSAC